MYVYWYHHLSPIHLNTYVMGLRLLEIFPYFQYGDRLYKSECDIYRRQILTYKKNGPRAEVLKCLCIVWFKELTVWIRYMFCFKI